MHEKGSAEGFMASMLDLSSETPSLKSKNEVAEALGERFSSTIY
jgi:hypothetical protein